MLDVAALIKLVVILIVLGVGLWAVQVHVKMDQTIKSLVSLLVIAVCLLLVLRFFGVI